MTQASTGRFGRPTAACRQGALAQATDCFLAGERVEMVAIAREIGVARASMYRWFKAREILLGEMLAALGERRLAAHRRASTGGGAVALVETLSGYSQELLSSIGLRALLAREPERALRILTSSDGIVQPRIIAAVERLIDAEVQARRFVPSVAPGTLAYAVVRLGEAFIYNDAAIGSRGDIARLHEVHAALLGVRPDSSRGCTHQVDEQA